MESHADTTIASPSLHRFDWPVAHEDPTAHEHRHLRPLPNSAIPSATPVPESHPVIDGTALTRRRQRATITLLLMPLRIFLAAGWLRAAAEKIVDGHWWTGSALRTFLHAQHAEALPFFRPIMDRIVEPSAMLIAICVIGAELVCGVLFALGRRVRLALLLGVAMNVTFVLCGVVNPSCFYLVMEAVLLLVLVDGVHAPARSFRNSRWPVLAMAWFSVTIVFVPFIRTIEPAKVIADPASMLAFLAFILGMTEVYRWLDGAGPSGGSVLAQRWHSRIEAWVGLPPRPTLYEQRLAAIDAQRRDAHASRVS